MQKTFITNNETLIETVGNDLKDVIEDVSTWLLWQIIMTVESNVYNVGSDPIFYERLEFDGGFLGAWSRETTQFVGNYISNTIGFDPTRIIYNPKKHQHGNSVKDRHTDMAYLIEHGTGYDFGGNASMRREFWFEIEKIINDGTLDSVLEAKMTQKGIVWLKV